MAKRTTPPDDVLIGKINECIQSGKSYDTPLETDQRVLARVTDGIYRQPGSALRELIANAYDADATIVSINTDSPRFGSIQVTDNGIGMSPQTLANLVLHIGGSAKRTKKGPKYGMASKEDPNLSNSGRRLIGKIGIGLFSVAQLSRQFVIITKTKGADYHLLAHVTLNRFDEGELAKVDADGKHPFRAGEARIWAEKTSDTKGHGTTIKLTAILPPVRRLLQSFDVWNASDEQEQSAPMNKRKLSLPKFHIGQIDPKDPTVLRKEPSYPWTEPMDERGKFQHLVEGMAKACQVENRYARLEFALDNYFQMIWSLGLSLPIDYVGKRPFQLNGKDISRYFTLPERPGPSGAHSLKVGPSETVGGKAHLPPPNDHTDDFAVIIDGIRLARPIRFDDFPKTEQVRQEPVLFVGYAKPDMSKIPDSQRGGDLAFSGYFYWVPKVVPREHNGLLVRINGASGTLFDSTFLKYQVAERRLNQLVAEVYVETGLEGALNIDRESFNTAHPHYQILANWVHNSLRLIRNTLKDLQGVALKKSREEKSRKDEETITKTTDELITKLTGRDPDEVPEVVFVEDEDELETAVADGKLAYLRDEIDDTTSPRKMPPTAWMESHAGAVARLLEAHGLLEDLDREGQTRLIVGIVKLFNASK